jgi:hypothetical protein
MTVSTKDEETDAIHVQRGIKQGCPLSGLLFNLAIDPILQSLESDGAEHPALAFADDISPLANKKATMQRNLDKVVGISKRLALFLNIKKCVSLHVSGKTPVGSRNTTFFLDGQPMRYLVEGEFTMFLGKPVGSNFLNPVAALKDMMDLGLKRPS